MEPRVKDEGNQAMMPVGITFVKRCYLSSCRNLATFTR